MSKKLYVPKWGNGETIEIGEYKILLPDIPPEKNMVNYGKKIKDQKFKRVEIPKNLHLMPPDECRKIISREWHRRKHGLWYLIKGKPFYFSGAAYTYYNYWVTEKGTPPDFRLEGWEFFTFWDFCVRDENCMGILDFKARRIGDTDKSLFLLGYKATGTRNAYCGMQHVTAKDSKRNYMRLIKSWSKMPFFFKPLVKVSEFATSKMEYDLPNDRSSMKKLRSGSFGAEAPFPGLGSSIDYEATEEGKYDGQRLDRYHFDEVGKVSVTELDIEKQWSIVSKCLTLNMDIDIVGKAIMSSTIEEVGSGDNLKVLNKMWKQSDPNNRTGSGRTGTGLYRIFRGYEKAAKCDEWGFPKLDEVRKFRKSKVKFYEDEGDMVGLVNFKRKFPANPREALGIGGLDCPFDTILINKRLEQIREGLNWKGEKMNPEDIAVRGNLHWKHGFGSSLRWVPDPNGKWSISRHPYAPNKRDVRDGLNQAPGNKLLYRIGADPVSAYTESRDKSRGAFVVREVFNPANEPLLKYDAGKLLNPWDKKTDRDICSYYYRDPDPYIYFEDLLKTAIYYGSSVYLETNKRYVENKFREEGFYNYLQRRVREAAPNVRAVQKSRGQDATTKTISLYVDAMATDIKDNWYTYNHVDILEDMGAFTTKSRTKHDLTVAKGFAHLGGMSKEMLRQLEENKEEKDEWDAFSTYDERIF